MIPFVCAAILTNFACQDTNGLMKPEDEEGMAGQMAGMGGEPGAAGAGGQVEPKVGGEGGIASSEGGAGGSEMPPEGGSGAPDAGMSLGAAGGGGQGGAPPQRPADALGTLYKPGVYVVEAEDIPQITSKGWSKGSEGNRTYMEYTGLNMSDMIHLAGRSRGFKLDKIVLYKVGTPYGMLPEAKPPCEDAQLHEPCRGDSL